MQKSLRCRAILLRPFHTRQRFCQELSCIRFKLDHFNNRFNQSFHTIHRRPREWNVLERLSDYYFSTPSRKSFDMNVTPDSFHAELPAILRSIANAHFIAFDLELSGIPAGARRKRKGPDRQTLQERYAEMKLSAETFNILQFGLTTVEEDPENGRYLTRAYNFNLSPMVTTSLVDMDRTITYSSGAVDFLLRNGYQIDAPFVHGIPYLMQNEASEMKELLEEKLTSLQSIPDIKLDGNEGAQRVTERIKSKIDRWLVTLKPNKTFLVIEPSPGTDALNSFERRLIYQLIRSSYPDLVAASSYPGCMRISTKANAEGENRIDSLRKRNASVFSEQFGFSWIPKAMQGASLSEFDSSVLAGNPVRTGAGHFIDTHREKWEALKNSLDGHKTILVGHNCFIDLIFFYRCFCGELPDKVEDFSAAIAAIFPLVVDTKYLATAIPNNTLPRGSELWRISESLAADQSLQINIETAAGQPDYENSGSYHEAGYDSFMTALAFLRLASKFGVASGYIDTDTAKWPARALPKPDLTTNFVQNLKNKKIRPSAKQKDELGGGKFFHKNIFDTLSNDEAIHSSPSTAEPFERPLSSSNAVKVNVTMEKDGTTTEHLASVGTERIPPWTNRFWREYGNKLRVYGTNEEVCELRPARIKVDDVNGDESSSPDTKSAIKKDERTEEGTDKRQAPVGGSSFLEMTGIKKAIKSISG